MRKLVVLFTLVAITSTTFAQNSESSLGSKCKASETTGDPESGYRVKKIDLSPTAQWPGRFSGTYQHKYLGTFEVTLFPAQNDEDIEVPGNITVTISQKGGPSEIAPKDVFVSAVTGYFSRVTLPVSDSPVKIEASLGRIGILSGGVSVMLSVTCQSQN